MLSWTSSAPAAGAAPAVSTGAALGSCWCPRSRCVSCPVAATVGVL